MKKIISFIVLFLLVSLITIVSFACDVPVEISVDPKLNLVNKDVTLTIGDEIDVTYTIENEKEGLEIKIEADSDKVSVDGKKIKALAEGVANVSVYIVGYESIKANFKITVNKLFVQTITITGDTELYVGKEGQVSAAILPENATLKDFEWSSSNPKVATVDQEGKVVALSTGTTVIVATAKDGSGVVGEMEVKVVKDKVKPVIEVDETIIAKDCKVNYNEPFDPLKGVKATDNVDGDITDKVEVKTLHNKIYYTAIDSSGNKKIIFRNIKYYRLTE